MGDNNNYFCDDQAREYRDGAEVFIIERRRLFSVLKSFYMHFMKDGGRRTILDLGCNSYRPKTSQTRRQAV